MNTPCPCGSNLEYQSCCGYFHSGQQHAPTAEALMRSRYSAYVLNNGKYLFKTWYPSTRPSKKSLVRMEPTEWAGLKILRTESGGPDDTKGVVEFIATFKHGDKIQQLRESSRFIRENDRWFYVDGDY